MQELVKTMKLLLVTTPEEERLFRELTCRYADACNEVSQYVFDNDFPLDSNVLHDALYRHIRSAYGLKSQMSCSVFKTVTAHYKAVETQLEDDPFTYVEGKYVREIPKDLDVLWKPVHFSRPQADLVRNRDYSFVNHGKTLSLNTLSKRVRCAFVVPDNFKDYFDGSWEFGTGKLVSLKGRWYFHIPMTKKIKDPSDAFRHVVGIDRGIRFMATTYDEKGKTRFYLGKEVQRKR